MAHNSENFGYAESLINTIRSAGQTTTTQIPEVVLPRQPIIDFESLKNLVFDEFDNFAQIISQAVPDIILKPQPFNTSRYYKQPGNKMFIFSLSKQAANTPISLNDSKVVPLTALTAYDPTLLTNSDLAIIAIEQRHSESGQVIETSVRSHGETPATIISRIPGAVRIINHPGGHPELSDTTVRLTATDTDTEQTYTQRIHDALETTTAGIIAHHQSQTRQVRQNLLNAA